MIRSLFKSVFFAQRQEIRFLREQISKTEARLEHMTQRWERAMDELARERAPEHHAVAVPVPAQTPPPAQSNFEAEMKRLWSNPEIEAMGRAPEY